MIHRPHVARPRLAPVASAVDVAVVGAGAAGIAAARRCLEAGLSVAVLEARDHVGGRAVTASFGGHPVDLGAHWMHAGRLNPLVRLGLARGEPLRRSGGRGGGLMLVEGRRQPRAVRDGHARAFDTADRAIAAAARAPEDASIARVMPGLGRWTVPVAGTLALVSGRPLAEVSAKDFPSEEFGDNWFVRGGYGAMLARLATGLPVALGAPVQRIDRRGRRLVLETSRGRIEAAAAIVTVPLPVLAAGSPGFAPALPEPVMAAASGFLPGTYEHAILNWPSAPRIGPDKIVKLVSRRLSLGLMSWMDGAPFHYLELDHATVRAARSPDGGGIARLVRGYLAEQIGARATRDLRVLGVTDWVGDRWSRGAWAVAPPGHFAARDVFAEPIDGRIWIAGEANTRSMWGTVGGAWSSGESAAAAAAASLATARSAKAAPAAAAGA